MNEQPLDLRRSLDALRRRRVAIAIVGLLGLCLGLLNVAAHRTPPTAVAVVLIPGQAGQNGNMAPIIQGQAYVATTPALRDPVIKSLTPPVRPGQVGVKVTASDSVLSIRADVPQAQQAIALANGVAANYIGWVKTHQPPGVGSAVIIQPAAMARPASFFSRAFKNGGMGLFAGLLIAVIVVLVRAKRDNRLRRRDQIARAIGIPVLAAIESAQYKTAAQWRRLL